MKGRCFYGLRIKQLSVFLIAVVCITIVIWGWEKTPLLTSLLPPQSNVLQLSPDEGKPQVPQGEIGSKQAGNKSVDLIALVDYTNTRSFVTEKAKKNSTTSGEKSQDEAKHHAPQGEIGSKQAGDKSVDLIASVDYTNTSSFVSEKAIASVDHTNTSSFVSEKAKKNSTTSGEKSQETTMSVIEESEFKQVSEGVNSSRQEQDLVAPMSSANTDSSVRGEDNNTLTTHVEKQACNYAKGKWVTNDSWPLYSGFGCKRWLSGMWACRLTQRTDFAYEQLHWLPKDCEMEKFTQSKFLRRMQNKTLAFVGDSLGRQQFQSLMCMITGGEERPDVVDVGREYGLVKARGAAHPDGWAYRFPSTNTTILFFWSASLCDLEPLDMTNPATDYAMHLDRPPSFLYRFLHKFDVLVLNTGHHWNRGKLRANRWVMHVGGVPNTNRKITQIGGAKNFTTYSIVNWVNSQLPKYPGLKAFYRSISPRHFFNGDWNTGGTCDNTSPLSGGKEVLQNRSSDPLAARAVKGTRVKLLDITGLSQLRDEGHISRYSIKATPGVQDCLHWCLPGIPDAWNEILFAQI